MLSTRGTAAARNSKKDLMFEVMANTYDSETNPDGFINLGVAENTLMHPELLSHLKKNFHPPSSAFSYGSGPSGSLRLRNALADFFNAHFDPVVPVSSCHVNASRGVTSSLERLAYELGDPGDKFLLGRPYYGSYQCDLRDRAGIEVAPVSFGEIDPCSEASVACYEAALLTELANPIGGKVRAILLCNPHNPLGRCYSQETLLAFMGLCQRYSIHLVVDEIYALSVFPNPDAPSAEPFTSALSIDTANIIDPALVHVVWGLSKDFGANSLRIGCVVSQHNPTLMSVLDAHAAYSFPSALLDFMACTILEDKRFVRLFITESQRRLAENYALTTSFLRRHGITFQAANAGVFLWVDLGLAWRRQNAKMLDIGDGGWGLLADEMDGATNITDDITRKLVRQRVYLASGDASGSEEPGWFRIVFSQPRHLLLEGLRRTVIALDS